MGVDSGFLDRSIKILGPAFRVQNQIANSDFKFQIADRFQIFQIANFRLQIIADFR